MDSHYDRAAMTLVVLDGTQAEVEGPSARSAAGGGSSRLSEIPHSDCNGSRRASDCSGPCVAHAPIGAGGASHENAPPSV